MSMSVCICLTALVCVYFLSPRQKLTDVFFSFSSTIKEALVAFLMHHVNFIKMGAEQRRVRESESQRQQ
jgi:hypothetical protein